MKKVLSLVLAFAMILGSFGFVFANQYPDVKDTEYYSEPVNVLSGLGVVNGYPDGTFGTGKGITRAELATMLINCLGIPVAGKADTPFSDVPKAHWASGYIKYAANMGYVAGYSDGTFKPDKKVSYDEALTMIVASLGYTSEGLGGTWPGNFINQARGLGILKICKTTGSADATREDVCCFLYKALTASIGKTNKDGEFVATVVETLPPFNTPVYDTMISRLGAVDFNGGNPFIVSGNENSQVNLGEYLGAYITAYADEDSGDIIAIKEVKSEFVEDTVENLKKTFKNTDGSIWDDVVDYFENGEGAGTEYINDTTEFSDSTVLKIAIEKKNAKAIKTLYSIQAWDVDGADIADEDVQEDINDDHKLLGFSFAEDDDKEIDMNSFVLLGRDSLADIAEGDVVYVYKNSKGISKVEVGTETVEGKITAMTSAWDQITVAGKKYALSDEADPAMPGELHTMMTGGTACTFFLDYAGKVYSYEEDKDATSDGYGVLINDWYETVKGKTTYYAEIFMNDGKSVEYELKDSSEYGAANHGDLISFQKNSKNVVSGITPYTNGPDDWEISKNGIITYSTNSADVQTKLTTSTVAFKYAGTTSLDDLENPEKYSVVTVSTMFGAKSKDVYSIYDGKTCKAVLVAGATGAEANEIAFVVDDGDETPEGQMHTVLYQGKVQDMNFEYAVTSWAEGTLTIDDNGVVTGMGPAPTYSDFNIPDLNTKAISYSGNIFTSTDGSNYDLEDELVIYVCDADGAWTVGSKSALKAKKGTLDTVWCLDMDGDDALDIIMIWEL